NDSLCIAEYLLVAKNPLDPFDVFISSNQNEFSFVRAELEEILRKVRVYNAKRLEGPVDKTLEAKYSHELIVPEVVEYTRGKDIEKKINMAIGRSHIYVGIFGNRASTIT